jgi:hypothetical protein
MFEYHQRTADEYAERSHEMWNHSEISDGYSALSAAHHQFAMACGKLAGVDLSQCEGEM